MFRFTQRHGDISMIEKNSMLSHIVSLVFWFIPVKR